MQPDDRDGARSTAVAVRQAISPLRQGGYRMTTQHLNRAFATANVLACASIGLARRHFVLAALAAGVVNNAAADTDTKAVERTESSVVVDQAWGGTGVSYDAVSVGPIVYVTYYDADRFFSVARVDTANREIQKRRLDSRFAGWDAHNSTALALDREGRLHISGNMHTAPLVYARMQRPGDLNSIVQSNVMIGRDEASVTYPRFFRFPDGALGFSYRSGKSGDGVEIINRWDGEDWKRLLSEPLFGPTDGGKRVSAYHTDYLQGPDGRFHVAWVWRETTQAETNFNVMYARSRDLRQWEDSRGRALSLPLTPLNAEVAAAIPPRSGLLNNIKVGFDGAGAPVISYLRYDNAGKSQLFHARSTPRGWQVVQATRWDYRWEFSGGGTLVGQIGFSGVRSANGTLLEDVAHNQYGRMQLRLDGRTLALIASTPSSASSPHSPPAGITAPYRPSVRSVRRATSDSVAGFIRWPSLGSDNNDHPRTCLSIRLANGCRMSGPLELLIE